MSRSKNPVPGRCNTRVHVPKDLRIRLAWGSCHVTIPAGSEGVVVSREKDYGGYNVALMDQTGEVEERSGPVYRFEIHFPDVKGLEDWETCQEGGTRIRAVGFHFRDGDLVKGRAKIRA